MNRFHFVSEHARRYGVKRLRQVIGLARSSYYHWPATTPEREAREAADLALAARIRAVNAESQGTYGAPRITAELRDEGMPVNHKRVARVMRKFGITGLRLRRRHATTVADQSTAKAPDLLQRDFTATEVNTGYVGEITYLRIGAPRFCYLATVMDLASRRLAGGRPHARRAGHRRAQSRRANPRQPHRSYIPHRPGAQYTAKAFADVCHKAGAIQSMGAVGTSAENAAAESLNAAFKRETLQGGHGFADEREARLAVFGWAHRYNTRRRHSRLGQISPLAYENTLIENSATLSLAA